MTFQLLSHRDLWWAKATVIVNKLHRKKVVSRWSVGGRPTTYWPPTNQPPTDHLPTTYRPLTDHFFYGAACSRLPKATFTGHWWFVTGRERRGEGVGKGREVLGYYQDNKGADTVCVVRRHLREGVWGLWGKGGRLTVCALGGHTLYLL